MRELNARRRAVCVQKVDNASRWRHVRILPQAGAVRRDAAARLDSGRLGDDETGAAERVLAHWWRVGGPTGVDDDDAEKNRGVSERGERKT